MCGCMVDIQSPTAKIRRGKEDRRQKPQHENIMAIRKKNKRQDENIYGLPYNIGWPQINLIKCTEFKMHCCTDISCVSISVTLA